MEGDQKVDTKKLLNRDALGIILAHREEEIVSRYENEFKLNNRKLSIAQVKWVLDVAEKTQNIGICDRCDYMVLRGQNYRPLNYPLREVFGCYYCEKSTCSNCSLLNTNHYRLHVCKECVPTGCTECGSNDCIKSQICRRCKFNTCVMFDEICTLCLILNYDKSCDKRRKRGDGWVLSRRRKKELVVRQMFYHQDEESAMKTVNLGYTAAYSIEEAVANQVAINM